MISSSKSNEKVTMTKEEFGARRIHGVTTRYLEELCAPILSSISSSSSSSSCPLKIFQKPTEEFHLPANDDLTKPLILIGPGTGIAPFIGFLTHRKALLLEHKKRDGNDTAANIGSVEVFFGCRHSDHDYLYQQELEAFQKDGVIDHLHTAFSRDGKKKEYVQNLMLDTTTISERLAHTIVHKAGIVYVCGDGNHMARDVQATLAELLGPTTCSDGKEYLETMKSDGRFVMDIWS